MHTSKVLTTDIEYFGNPGRCDLCDRLLTTIFYECDSSFNKKKSFLCGKCFDLYGLEPYLKFVRWADGCYSAQQT